MQQQIKALYQQEYPEDTLGNNINQNTTLEDVWRTVVFEPDELYATIGVSDSIVRERIFRMLADTMHIPYDTVYHAWLGDKENAWLALAEEK